MFDVSQLKLQFSFRVLEALFTDVDDFFPSTFPFLSGSQGGSVRGRFVLTKCFPVCLFSVSSASPCVSAHC